MDDTKLLLSFTVNDSTCVIESVNSDLQRIRNGSFDNYLMVFDSRGMSSKLLDFKLSLLGKDINLA